MYQALGGINTTTYYSASVYLYNSKAVLSNPSGINPVARHIFADSSGGTVDFSVQKGDPNGVIITSAEVRIANPDGSTDILALVDNIVSSTMSTYTATKAVLPQVDFAVGATTYVPEIVLTDSGAKTTKIPLPAYTIPGPVPVSLAISVSPPTVDAGGTAVLTIQAKDSAGNAIQNVPISGSIALAPGGDALLSPLGGSTPAYQPSLNLSSVPGSHKLLFAVNSPGYEGVSATVIITGLPRLVLNKRVETTGSICAGQALTYTVSWSKGGTSTIYDITITDTLPNGTTYSAPSIDFFAQPDGLGVPLLASTAYSSSVSGPWTPGEPPDGTGIPLVLRWTIDRLAPGHSGYLKYSVLVSATLNSGAIIWNRASATLSSDGTVFLSDIPSNTIAIPGTLVSRLSTSRYASLGQWFPVTLTVTNTGATPITGVSPDIAFGPGSSLVDVITSPFTLTILTPGSSTNFTWTVSASGSGLVTFTATASGTACGFMAVQSSSSVSATMQTPANLAGSPITFIPSDACIGRQLRITLSATNTGEANAVQVVGIPALSLEGSANAGLVSSPVMIPVLAGGNAANFTWTYTLTGAGSMKYTATVTGIDANSGFPISTGPLTSGSLTVRNAGILTTQSTATVPTVCSGGQWVDVQLNVKNTGGDDAVNIIPQMSIPAGGSLVTLKTGPSPGGPLTLATGMSQTFIWTYSTSGSGSISFQPSTVGDTCGGSPLQASGQVGLQVKRPAHLVVSAVATPPIREVGQPFDVVFTIRNDGDAKAYWAMPDSLPSGYGTGTAVEWKQVKAGPDHLLAGESSTWKWSYSPTGTGSLVFSVTAYGQDENTLLYVYSGTVTGQGVTIVPAGSMELAVTSAQASPKSVFTGEDITVSVTVRNTGAVALWGVTPIVQPVPEGGASVAPAGTVPGTADLVPGASATFSVTFHANSAGTVRFQTGASAAEGSVSSPQLATGQVVIYASQGDVVVYPNPVRFKGSVRGTVKFAGLAIGAKFTVYTLRGLKVWQNTASGARIEWDGKNSEGHLVIPGTYYWTAEGAGMKKKGTLVVE